MKKQNRKSCKFSEVYKCFACICKFKGRYKYICHLIEVHIPRFDIHNSCDQCLQRFKFYHELIIHHEKTHTETMYSCEDCGNEWIKNPCEHSCDDVIWEEQFYELFYDAHNDFKF